MANLKQVFTRFQLGVDLHDIATSDNELARRFRNYHARVVESVGPDIECPTLVEMLLDRPAGWWLPYVAYNIGSERP